MARNRSPNRDKAFEIYARHDGKIKNADIAKILNEDPKTVSKWKTLDKWVAKLEKIRKRKKGNKKESDEDIEVISPEDITVEEEKECFAIDTFDELTEKQILFCLEYLRCFNATKSYQRVYGTNRSVSAACACKLLKKPNIQLAVAKLRNNRINQAMLKPEDIFQKYMDIAFFDLTDVVHFGMSEDGKTSYVEINNFENVDGTLLTAVKETKTGLSITGVAVNDRLRALDWLAEHMDMATEEQKAKVDSLRSKVFVEQEKLKLQQEANW